jgi:hypothetical protein
MRYMVNQSLKSFENFHTVPTMLDVWDQHDDDDIGEEEDDEILTSTDDFIFN